MKIYLNNELLLESQVFENPYLEQSKRSFGYGEERDWIIYTWNSKDKLRGEEDGTSRLNYNTIEAKLEDYEIIVNHD